MKSRDYHSVIFGDKNTWDDWHLIPASRPVFQPPVPKLSYVDVPGNDGALDLTENLIGDVTYSNRQGSMEFYVANGYWGSWALALTTITNYLHGRKMKAKLMDEPEFYYVGRFSVNQWKSDPYWSRIVIDYNTEPYKYDIIYSNEDWLWDPFNFGNGIIRKIECTDLVVKDTLITHVRGRRKLIVPEIQFDSDDGKGLQVRVAWTTHDYIKDIDVTDYSKWVMFPANNISKSGDIKIKEGDNRFEFVGNGKVSLLFRGASL